MRVLEKIIGLKTDDNSIESTISTFLLKDIQNAENWTHKYISENTHCSKSSLSRYVNKLGFKNFNEFYYTIHDENKSFENQKIEPMQEIKFNTFNNLKIILEWLNKNNVFFDLREILLSKRRIFIISDILSTGLITTAILDLVYKKGNVQILNINNVEESMLSYFDTSDVFINIILKNSEIYYTLFKQLFDRKITCINVSNKSLFSIGENTNCYNINLPAFKKNKQISEIMSVILLLSTLNDYI